MAETYEPLLHSPKTSYKKTIFLLLSLVSIIGLATIFSLQYSNLTLSNPPLQNICNNAHNKTSCLGIITDIASSSTSKKPNHVTLLQILLEKSKTHIQNSIKDAHHVRLMINDHVNQADLDVCFKLMDLSIHRIHDSILALQKVTVNSHADAHAWLSSVLTNHFTCLDGLDGGPVKSIMEPDLNELIAQSRASLALLVGILPARDDFSSSLYGNLPSWVTRKDRRLLEARGNDIKANVIVATDGSGKYKTVKEAVAAAPDNGKTRYVIYVKKGIYKENVDIGKTKKNLMLVGDGMDSTIITGSLNDADGTKTYDSATVASVGDGFIAQDIWFQNTAGPHKHQAVALRVNADQSVINRCRIDAYQDSLYTHSLRQFYRDCYITGTVDFIFGNAAVVFQNCKIVARKPMNGQKNMVTAQGRTDPNQNTGTSIQKCDIIASPDLNPVKGSIPTYLGRPWKEYSRTVIMQSNVGDHIDPAGWSPWDDKGFALKTLYYGEYMNRGPGAGIGKRVKWSTYHVITNVNEAKKFTVAELIQGGVWLKSTGVAYTEGL